LVLIGNAKSINPIASNTRIAKIVVDMMLLQMRWSDRVEAKVRMDSRFTEVFETDARMSANKPRGRWPKVDGRMPGAGDAEHMGWRGRPRMWRLAKPPCKAAMAAALKDHNRRERGC